MQKEVIPHALGYVSGGKAVRGVDEKFVVVFCKNILCFDGKE